MKKSPVLVVFLSACLALGSCTKENPNKGAPQNDTIPVTIASLTGNWRLVNDTTTQLAGIMTSSSTPKVGINYTGKAGDYYSFTSNGKLNFHNNDVTGEENYKLSHDTVFVEYAYVDGQTNHVDSAYSPIYIVSRLTDHNCTMTSHLTGLEMDSFSTINLSR